MEKQNELEIKNIEQKILPILKKYDVKKASLFGSIVKGRATEKSDVDILVEIGENLSLLDFIGLKLELEEILGRKVDLVEYRTVKPALKKYILDEQLSIL